MNNQILNQIAQQGNHPGDRLQKPPRKVNPYNQWRKAVFARDGHKCVLCGSTERLESDHIKSFTLYPESRYDVANGRVLCRECHKKTPNYGGKTRRDWSAV